MLDDDRAVSDKEFFQFFPLLGKGCHLDFDGYQAFYREQYSPWAAEHIRRISE